MSGVPVGLVDATPPRLLRITRTLFGVIADVPLSVYGPGPLESRLNDLEWVSEAAVAHEMVIEHFMKRRGVTVVPMKLFTMFSRDDRIVEEIAGRRQAIGRIMRRIAGAEEWGIRVARGGPQPSATAPARRPGTGAAFLAARKHARDQVQVTRALVADAAAAAFTALAKKSRAAVQRDVSAVAGQASPLLDAAFLVPVRSRAAFTRAARQQALECSRAGAQLTLTGPWPPYNFVRLDGEP